MNTLVTVDGLRSARSTTIHVRDADLQVTERSGARQFVLLHGGAGPGSMAGFADLLAHRLRAQVWLPTHPGFSGTDRPAALASARDLAAAYLDVFDELELADVTLIGNSFGGWLAAEMALLDSSRVSGVVIVNGIGIEVPGHPVADMAALSPVERVALSFHDPATAAGSMTVGAGDAPAGPSPDLQALAAYAGRTNCDPTLVARLRGLQVPAHVIWGAGDGVVDLDYGRAYADALPRSTFTVIPDSGHFPQLETPEELLGVVVEKLART